MVGCWIYVGGSVAVLAFYCYFSLLDASLLLQAGFESDSSVCFDAFEAQKVYGFSTFAVFLINPIVLV